MAGDPGPADPRGQENGVSDRLAETLRCLLVDAELTAAEHAGAIEWIRHLGFPAALVWVPSGWAERDGGSRAEELISGSGIRRIRSTMRSGHAGLQARA